MLKSCMHFSSPSYVGLDPSSSVLSSDWYFGGFFRILLHCDCKYMHNCEISLDGAKIYPSPSPESSRNNMSQCTCPLNDATSSQRFSAWVGYDILTTHNINTGRFVMYSGITKICYRKTVGHVFTKPVQIDGTTQFFLPPVSCFFCRSSHFCR